MKSENTLKYWKIFVDDLIVETVKKSNVCKLIYNQCAIITLFFVNHNSIIEYTDE